MKEMKIDLSDLRCPDALINARAAVRKLMSQSAKALHLCAIEPSLLRDLRYANEHEGWGLRIDAVTRPVPKLLKKKWASDEFPEIYDGVSELALISLYKPQCDFDKPF